jgi:hypothetical protein
MRDIAEVIEEERSKVEAKTPITEEVRGLVGGAVCVAGLQSILQERHASNACGRPSSCKSAPWPHHLINRNLAGACRLFVRAQVFAQWHARKRADREAKRAADAEERKKKVRRRGQEC